MFKIGDFSKICRVPVSALRYYADLGLLLPAHIDSFTGYRYYTLDQLPRLNRILALRDLGLSLEEIGRLLHEELSPDELRGMFRLQQARIQQQVEQEQARLARVAVLLQQIEKEGKMPQHEVILKPVDSLYAAAIRQIIPIPSGVGDLLGEAFTALMQRGIQPIGAPLAIFHDEEFKPADLDVEIVLPVAPTVHLEVALGEGRLLQTRHIPAVTTVASTIHMGSYDHLNETYSALGQWISANGYQLAGPSREIYLTAPGDPSGLVTELQWPVEKA